jgi:RecG-like helicase
MNYFSSIYPACSQAVASAKSDEPVKFFLSQIEKTIQHFITNLPFHLTPSQVSSWQQILDDLKNISNEPLSPRCRVGQTEAALLQAI